MTVSDSGIAGGRDFPVTSWSALVAARDPSSPEYQRHLQRLVELYWRPVYMVIRSYWQKSTADAKDLTQEFFTRAFVRGTLLQAFSPERGSFRAYVRGALLNFLRLADRDAKREKRGGGMRIASLEGLEETGTVLPGAEAPDRLFDQYWRETVMDEALKLVQERLLNEGKASVFAVFSRYELEGGRQQMSYEEVGAPLGLKADQVKRALSHGRAALRQAVTDVVRGYVDGHEELAAELRRLLE